MKEKDKKEMKMIIKELNNIKSEYIVKIQNFNKQSVKLKTYKLLSKKLKRELEEKNEEIEKIKISSKKNLVELKNRNLNYKELFNELNKKKLEISNLELENKNLKNLI